ncbi:hypothetical protein [Spongiimicrobium salis]|uniref:hypothetical protein n=1 Tax=Spongiimicrobium salis TaxID=1667022 RepID=UPI00374CFB97
MKMYLKLGIVLCFFSQIVHAQEKPIKVIEEKIPNRIALYALNETDTDYDVKIEIKGVNIRQSKAKPRFIRVPATSKVHLKTIIPIRGKKHSYTYTLNVNDSLSRRALRKPFTIVKVPPRKIKPKRPITLYVTENCMGCDSIIAPLTRNNYIFIAHYLKEKPEIRKQLSRSFPNTPLDSIKKPIVNLGGRLYTWIANYEELLEELNKE